MESAPSLPETLRRIEAHIQDRGLQRSEVLNPRELAARTALPETTVHVLLQGGTPPADTVGDRVRCRIKALADAHMTRHGGRMSDLAGEISRRLGVSEYWARQVCDGRKVPSVEFLHGLVDFFGVEGGESFFTAPAAEALSRVLLPVLRRLDDPGGGYAQTASPADTQETLEEVLQRFRDLDEQEQLRALMRQFGVDPDAVAFRGGRRPSPSQLAALLILALKDDE
ncbi:transcriptional regulator [Streptomyces sp. NBC_00557]|uniref:transcriptional regulator n=1 Tax=Streptomyces sp. NBC_00557 TaxID=2975776 RepID=UPI002E7FC4DF|nr:transcriptional regulator [Streptomyces sp. NBC_00557]WUC40307.1 transcriptional regulator [Streptomyces sp. NBC_00557]